MLVGDPQEWAARFRTLDLRFLERVIAVWPRCLAVLPDNPHEDTITINLVAALSKDLKARRLFHLLVYQHEPFGYTDDGRAYSKGKIDMAVLVDQDRERYLAYECKRLNVTSGGKWQSLATQYIEEGIARFVTEKYAADLPLGCMLGYVMDGSVSTARVRVQASMISHREEIGLAWGPMNDEPLGMTMRMSSGHQRVSGGAMIEIRHALLPFGV